ncbi:unnamed protein product [Arctia plantaginis]|uniref:Chitin-binding type-2 domain-containing protein n=1 Tax=Arctia plantaginis TaxID=874455 RepID=A0A8S1AVM0_ARCPL|nr:unnamed protein product [Arctia plantaginis]
MEILTLYLCVIPAFVTAITITSNGNSPESKMKRGLRMDIQKDFVTMAFSESTTKTARVKPTNTSPNSTKLSINERYRRLIPYMTFYYANDLARPNADSVRNIEVQKAELIETGHSEPREPKKIVYSNRNIPIYEGNRLTQHNIASANPTKVFYQGGVPVYQTPNKVIQNFHPSEYYINDFEPGRVVQKLLSKNPNVVYISPMRKPFLNLYSDDTPNIRYYLSEKDQSPKYRLVPYEQTPPFKIPENEKVYDITKKPVSVLIPKELTYLKPPRPASPHYVYEEVNVQQPVYKKQPLIVSENYYEKQLPYLSAPPLRQNGFQPIFNSPKYPHEEPRYIITSPEKNIFNSGNQKYRIQPGPVITIDNLRPKFYTNIVEHTTVHPPHMTTSNQVPLASLLNSLQLNKSIPKPITKENVGASIRTLLQVLNALKAVPQNDMELPVLSTPKPFVAAKVVEIVTEPVIDAQRITEQPELIRDEGLHDEPYLAHVSPPSQHLDDLSSGGGTSQQFPLPVTSDDEGGTPGQPGIDYPILTVIPPTSFNCKTQRYKGFFADPESRCQVWHYCDLNGGQASFLCPNGTIFSQAALTCDWWFNVRCNTTTQLYVLNESLYKYILPHSPKFPEDYSGPLVDKYLTLKFKEMEEQFKKNKNKQSVSEKMDSGEEESASVDDSTEKDSSSQDTGSTERSGDAVDTVNEPSVILESPGTSGNVERLQK